MGLHGQAKTYTQTHKHACIQIRAGEQGQILSHLQCTHELHTHTVSDTGQPGSLSATLIHTQTSPELTYFSFTSSICTTGEYFMANGALQLYLLCSALLLRPLHLSCLVLSPQPCHRTQDLRENLLL